MRSPRTSRFKRLLSAGGIATLSFATATSYAGMQPPEPHSTSPATSLLATDITRALHQETNRGNQPRSRALHSSPAKRLAARTRAMEKSAETERQVFGAHIQDRPRTPDQRQPTQQPLSQWVDTGYDHSSPERNILQRPSFIDRANAMTPSAMAAACGQFTGLDGATLVAAVKAADTACINGLFSLTGTTAADTFAENKMVAIADALAGSAASYDGTNSDSTLQLILFLRAGYYVQFYDPAVGDYGPALRNAIRPALNAFTSNANFDRVDDAHGEVLAEFMTLIDSSSENAQHLSTVKRVLDDYGQGYDSHFWMLSAVNNAYIVLFRGHQNPDFQQVVQSDTSIIDTLYDFANRNFALMGTTNDYLVSNAGRELGRFLQYDGAAKSLASSRAKALIDRSSVTGSTAPLWVGVGEMVDYYDQANCSYYGLCDFSSTVESAALPISHTCGPTLKIRAQEMAQDELADTCAIVAGQETYFHERLLTSGVPVPDDYNESLEMVVFNSSTDYGTYAGAIYGIDTNNGGMYLEGDPSRVGNQARFIAYEAEWLQPEAFEIWNLTHEYIHYLDGRFNMYGDFADAMAHETVWWVEGLAEYLSYSYREQDYADARSEAANGTYNISTIYHNDYNSSQQRIYSWGYLAVRYMFENQAGQVDDILSFMRPGEYSAYAGYMGSLATSNDADFAQWLPCVADATCDGGGDANEPPVAAFSETMDGLTATFTSSSTDPDGTIAAYSWEFGDGNTATVAAPTHNYAQPGDYQVSLEVTDDRGASDVVSRIVTATDPSGDTTECEGAAPELGGNCARSNLTVAEGEHVYMYVEVPQGTGTLTFTTSGGSGDVDLYVNTLGEWATRESHNYRSTNNDNDEQVIVDNPPAGQVYVSLYGNTAASGVSISTES